MDEGEDTWSSDLDSETEMQPKPSESEPLEIDEEHEARVLENFEKPYKQTMADFRRYIDLMYDNFDQLLASEQLKKEEQLKAQQEEITSLSDKVKELEKVRVLNENLEKAAEQRKQDVLKKEEALQVRDSKVNVMESEIGKLKKQMEEKETKLREQQKEKMDMESNILVLEKNLKELKVENTKLGLQKQELGKDMEDLKCKLVERERTAMEREVINQNIISGLKGSVKERDEMHAKLIQDEVNYMLRPLEINRLICERGPKPKKKGSLAEKSQLMSVPGSEAEEVGEYCLEDGGIGKKRRSKSKEMVGNNERMDKRIRMDSIKAERRKEGGEIFYDKNQKPPVCTQTIILCSIIRFHLNHIQLEFCILLFFRKNWI